MLDLVGCELLAEERDRLLHPAVGGVILFARNYESREQLQQLVAGLHGLRSPRLLVAVDHEGGRVQRFRRSFTRLPAARRIGENFDRDPEAACQLARACGWLTGVELGAVGIDLGFSPVLDVYSAASPAIGERAFHAHPEVVARLANAHMTGMRTAGMSAVGKHFPGHGSVAVDSHMATPTDDRDIETLEFADLLPFERLIQFGLPAIMPAHIVFSKVDHQAVGFSEIWLQRILRGKLGFQGAIFSDDLGMEGASCAGRLDDRCLAAIDAGCDMILVCNKPEDQAGILERLGDSHSALRSARLARMHGRPSLDWQELQASDAYHQARELLAFSDPELDLG